MCFDEEPHGTFEHTTALCVIDTFLARKKETNKMLDEGGPPKDSSTNPFDGFSEEDRTQVLDGECARAKSAEMAAARVRLHSPLHTIGGPKHLKIVYDMCKFPDNTFALVPHQDISYSWIRPPHSKLDAVQSLNDEQSAALASCFKINKSSSTLSLPSAHTVDNAQVSTSTGVPHSDTTQSLSTSADLGTGEDTAIRTLSNGSARQSSSVPSTPVSRKAQVVPAVPIAKLYVPAEAVERPVPPPRPRRGSGDSSELHLSVAARQGSIGSGTSTNMECDADADAVATKKPLLKLYDVNRTPPPTRKDAPVKPAVKKRSPFESVTDPFAAREAPNPFAVPDATFNPFASPAQLADPFKAPGVAAGDPFKVLGEVTGPLPLADLFKVPDVRDPVKRHSDPADVSWNPFFSVPTDTTSHAASAAKMVRPPSVMSVFLTADEGEEEDRASYWEHLEKRIGTSKQVQRPQTACTVQQVSHRPQATRTAHNDSPSTSNSDDRSSRRARKTRRKSGPASTRNVGHSDDEYGHHCYPRSTPTHYAAPPRRRSYPQRYYDEHACDIDECEEDAPSPTLYNRRLETRRSMHSCSCYDSERVPSCRSERRSRQRPNRTQQRQLGHRHTTMALAESTPVLVTEDESDFTPPRPPANRLRSTISAPATAREYTHVVKGSVTPKPSLSRQVSQASYVSGAASRLPLSRQASYTSNTYALRPVSSMAAPMVLTAQPTASAPLPGHSNNGPTACSQSVFRFQTTDTRASALPMGQPIYLLPVSAADMLQHSALTTAPLQFVMAPMPATAPAQGTAVENASARSQQLKRSFSLRSLLKKPSRPSIASAAA